MAVPAIEVVFHCQLFSQDVVARTAHRYTADFFVDVTVRGDSIVVCLTPKTSSMDCQDIEGRFRNDALDDRLRAEVVKQTRDIHAALVQAALSGAHPTSGKLGR